MLYNQQMVGENVYYQQSITGDTISGVPVWSATPAGPGLSGQQNTATSTVILFSSSAAGTYTLSVTIQTTGGQTLIGQIYIRVVTTKV
jgi:hypothetical protein